MLNEVSSSSSSSDVTATATPASSTTTIFPSSSAPAQQQQQSTATDSASGIPTSSGQGHNHRHNHQYHHHHHPTQTQTQTLTLTPGIPLLDGTCGGAKAEEEEEEVLEVLVGTVPERAVADRLVAHFFSGMEYSLREFFLFFPSSTFIMDGTRYARGWAGADARLGLCDDRYASSGGVSTPGELS